MYKYLVKVFFFHELLMGFYLIMNEYGKTLMKIKPILKNFDMTKFLLSFKLK